MRPEFTFGGAMSHFQNTGGPKGFLLKFALVYAVIGVATQALALWLQWPVYEIYIRAFTEGEGDISLYMDELAAVSMRSNLMGILMLPVSALVWAMFEAASQRRYMRSARFRLTVGADEGRLLVVALIWVAFVIAAYFAFAIGVLIPAVIGGVVFGAAGAVIFGIVAAIAALGTLLWLVARFSPAAALTVRDRHIRFFEAWNVTRGKGWTLFGCYLLMIVISLVSVLIFYGVLFAAGIAVLGQLDGTAPEEMTRALVTPQIIVPAALAGFVAICFQAALMHIFGGPAALAAKRDPAWAGEGGGVVDAFS
ncbi:hypothetical protein K1X12_07820 [Hyphomonas sp. WL0036]|uniref:hypothetical protein n=1 Tax=Hyphomonas sediminis TaxID=2866160 RepID=UPI001C80E8BE|nr:hypothetical protein [Hyphomonas sediminis]MBY9066804.1 hypothetical protein [Hyphomonas sediminis]